MQIVDKEAVEEVRNLREIPEIKPGYIVQLKVEVPENKRRVSIVKGVVIARRNAGLNSTFRIRRLVAGVGVESMFPLYSPNLREIKVVDKKKVRRAKLYYLRDKKRTQPDPSGLAASYISSLSINISKSKLRFRVVSFLIVIF
jgi:ribosomal protein L19